jgi:hypothetical protein
MNGPLASRTFPLAHRSIALAVTLAILIVIAPHDASAKGGTFRLWTAWSHGTAVSQPEATTVSHRRGRRLECLLPRMLPR